MKTSISLLSAILLFVVAPLYGEDNASPITPFDEQSTEWVEGVITTVQPDGTLMVNGGKSAYAGNYASYHREFFSFPETERDLRRKQLTEKYKGHMTYEGPADKNLNFTFRFPASRDVVVPDESQRYGTNFTLWSHNGNATPSHFRDLKSGDRVVVGYDTAEGVHSIFRVKPLALATGESSKSVSAPLADVDKNGVHVMNKSSNETNPIPAKPNRGENTIENTSGYANYPLVVPPTDPNTRLAPVSPNDGNTLSQNDARNNPPNSSGPGATPSVQSDPQRLPANSSRIVNSTTPQPTRPRSPEQQSYPSQFEQPGTTPNTFSQPNGPVAPTATQTPPPSISQQPIGPQPVTPPAAQPPVTGQPNPVRPATAPSAPIPRAGGR